MLGLTSYQEALRALGSVLDPLDKVSITEQPAEACIDITTLDGPRRFDARQLEELVLSSHARRGDHRDAGPLSDLLRAVGRALDELRASHVRLQLGPEALAVWFRDEHFAIHTLTYDGDELEALRQVAIARRNGQPLRRVLILHSGTTSMTPLVELLLAEFAIQALPTLYAGAVAAAAEPPDLILAHGGEDMDATITAIVELRAGKRTCAVPIVVMTVPGLAVERIQAAFAAGADDQLVDSTLPAQLRARVRTWMLRKRADP